LKKPSTKREKAERNNLYFFSSILLEELGIDNVTKQEILFEKFGKWSRKQLTLDELEHFVLMLEQMRDKNYLNIQ
jgi:hypothetical protein